LLLWKINANIVKKISVVPEGYKDMSQLLNIVLKKRGDELISFYHCEWCKSSFNQNWYLEKHLEICKEKKAGQKKIKRIKKEKKIAELKRVIEEKNQVIENMSIIIAEQKLELEKPKTITKIKNQKYKQKRK